MGRLPKRVELVDEASYRHEGRHEFQNGIGREGFVELYEDFCAPSGTTLPAWLATHDTSAAGAPTIDYVDDADAGEFQLLTAATDEAENIALYGGDNLAIDIAKNPKFECRIKVDADTFPWSADQRLVAGLAAARNATLDSNALHAWFRIEGASANILWESDDGTTDDDDNDSGHDLSDNSYVKLRIDCSDLTAVVFEVNLEDGNGWQSAGVADMTDASGNVQPYIELQKDGGTETEDVRIDYVKVVFDR